MKSIASKLFIVLMTLLLLWISVSYIEVITHNISTPGYVYYEWNLFNKLVELSH